MTALCTAYLDEDGDLYYGPLSSAPAAPSAAFDPAEKRDREGRWTSEGGEIPPPSAKPPLEADALWSSRQGQVRQISPSELDAGANIWYSPEAIETNVVLRTGRHSWGGTPTPEEQNRIVKFTGLIERSPAFTQPAVMWRGVINGPKVFGRPGQAKGKTFTDKGFVSLSASDAVASTYGANTMIRVHVPAGTHALHAPEQLWQAAGNPPGYPLSMVREYTLPPGSRFRVTAEKTGDPDILFDPRILDVDVLPPEAKQPGIPAPAVAAAGPPEGRPDLAGLPGGERFAWTPGDIEIDGEDTAAAFDPAEHPRIPGGKGGGQFTRKGGELDYTPLLGKDLGGYGEGSGKDDALAALAHLAGFDGPPDAVTDSELDARVAAGERECWRGLNGFNGGREEQTRGFARAFLNGPYFAGNGGWGNGTYTASEDTKTLLADVERNWADAPRDETGQFTESWARKSYARDIARAKGKARDNAAAYASSHGTLLRMTLDKNARVITWDDLYARWQQRYAQFLAHPPADDRAQRELKLLNDPGRFAIILGYDAVDISRPAPGEFLILNRTALHVSSRLQDAWPQ